MNNRTAKAKPKMTVKNGVVYGDALSAQEKKRIVMQKKKDRKAKKVRKSAQQTIPYVEMCRDGICKVNSRLYTKSIAFEDINYQLAQNEDKTAIFENWCDFLNYFDSSIFVQLSFINQKASLNEFRKRINIPAQEDAFNDIRSEYSGMLQSQLTKGNNGLVKKKYITFGIEADSLRTAKPKLERIETDILNNFKTLGVRTEPLSGYIDYERYGHDIAYDEQGRFTDEGYVRVASERWDRQFNGELDDIPDEYRITGSGEDAERDSTIAVLVVEPGKEPYVKEIDSGLESLQHEVGGCIEAIYPYEDPVALVCNEEGKLEGLPLNRALRDEDGDIYDVVAGTFMVVGLTDDSFGSLTVEQMQKFADHFKVPEQFVKLGDKIVATPMISKEQQKQESIEQKDFEMNADTSGLTVAGHIGTWHTIDQHEVGGHSFYLMEHDTYGDEAACIIVDERGKLVLDDVYNGFDDDTLRLLDLEVKEVPEMPDPALSVQDMKDYGYAWAGVLPAGQEAAEKALEKGCEVYRLYSDNTEGLCVDAKEIADHAAKGGMLGISKESWMAALEKENYLKAAEMSMEDDYGMIDGIINNGPKEDKTAEVKAPESGEKSSIMDRLKSAKAEKQKECCPPKKHKGEIEL